MSSFAPVATSRVAALAALVLSLCAVGVGCMPPQQGPPPAPCPALSSAAAPVVAPVSPRGDRHVYRFDFVLTTSDGSGPPSTTAFTLNLQEHDKGEMHVGRNVALSPPSASATGGGPPVSSARQDVGIKVAAQFQTAGDDALLDVTVEMSSFEPPSAIRKMVAKGNAVAALGKPAVVTTLEDGGKRYQLSVTPTKLR
jgi:hypothetical protein